MKAFLPLLALALGFLSSACSSPDQTAGAAGQGGGGAGATTSGADGGAGAVGGGGAGGGENGDVYGPWAGGAQYYAQFSHGPPADPSFFPITVWLQSPSS